MDDDANEMALDAALAEYAGIREEISERLQAQATMAGVGMTGLGVLSFFDQQQMLVLVPTLGLFLSWLHLGQWFWIQQLGSYVRDVLWPEVQGRSGVRSSWEHYIAVRVWKSPMLVTVEALMQGAVPFIFAACGAYGTFRSDAQGPLLVWNWLAVALTIGVPILVAYLTRPQQARG